MARLRGTGLGAGMAMGTAAVVRQRTGVPLMPEPPARITALIAQRRLTEVPDVVLVADDYRTALAISVSLNWAKVVGIVTERDDLDAAIPSFPVITGVAGLMRAAVDDVLILVDATRGVALIDPDPIYLAQYTAEHDRIAPKNRIYLDEAHLPAQTQDGRVISVVATSDSGSIEAALASGPDALYHALPLTFDPDELRRRLHEVVNVAAGKPLIFPHNNSLPLTPLLETAAYADVTLAVAPTDDAFIADANEFAILAKEIALSETECAQHDILTGTPRIAAEIHILDASAWPDHEALDTAIESAAAAGVTRLILNCAINNETLRSIADLAIIASINLLSVTLYLAAATREPIGSPSVRMLIAAGITGFLVNSNETPEIKKTIREVELAEYEGDRIQD